ncbi:MAG: TolC family protein [Armatimonadetes bacterium]|nr:TolC family protein [Armatimonadota bacterium]
MKKTLAAIISIGIIIGALAAIPLVAQEKIDTSGVPLISQAITLTDAVNIALKNNPSIAARRAIVAAASAKVGMAKAMTRPRISTTSFATTGNMPMIAPGPEGVMPQSLQLTPDRGRLDQNLMAEYPLYTGGRLKGKVNSAQALKEASAFEVAKSELDVSFTVKNAYFQALLACKMANAYQKRIDEAQERLRIAQDAFDTGRIAKYDLLRNKTDLAEAQQKLNNAQRDVEMATIDLKNMMGISQTSQITLSQDLGFSEAPANLDDLQAKALQQRPEIAAARARLRSSQADLGVAKSAYKPQVSAMAMADISAINAANPEKGYLVGIAAALPIFDGGLRKSSIDEAQAVIQQMQADEKEAVQMVSRDVASALSQLNAAAKNVTLSQTAITQADEDYRVIKLRYEAGKATNVEVLDALASLTRAQTDNAEALYNYNVAQEAITRAIGQR